jgi:hypothetical protein
MSEPKKKRAKKPKVSHTPKYIQELARAKFFRHTPLYIIAKDLELSPVYVENLIHNGNWRQERDERDKTLVQDYMVKKGSDMAAIGDLCLEIIKHSLLDFQKQGKPASLSEVKMLTDVFTSLDKVIKLDSGQATERTENHTTSLTPEELHEYIIKDVAPIDRFVTASDFEVKNAANRKRDSQRKHIQGKETKSKSAELQDEGD